MPDEFTITPETPGDAETVNIRVIFIKKNADFGNYSPKSPVTLS